MTAGSTVDVHHLLEGPEDAPVLVLSNSLGTTLGMWDEQAPALSERFRLLRAELIRDSIPDASLELIPDAAHLANMEQPEVVTQAILDHLSPVVREGR